MTERSFSRHSPSVWHLLYKADVRARGEYKERVRRREEQEKAKGSGCARHPRYALEDALGLGLG